MRVPRSRIAYSGAARRSRNQNGLRFMAASIIMLLGERHEEDRQEAFIAATSEPHPGSISGIDRVLFRGA